MRQLSEGAKKQGELWGKRARTWAEIQEVIERTLWLQAMEATDATAGKTLLDCGCGAGGAIAAAAERGVIPHGFDPSVNMLTIARERMPVADLRIGELEDIPWPNGEFDCVMANNSLQFARNTQLALHEMGRVCREGGKVAVAVWDQVEACDLGRVYEAVLALFPNPPRGRGVFALSAPGQLEQLFESVADLHLEGMRSVECYSEYGSLEEAVHGQMSAGATERAVEIFGEGRVREAVQQALEPLVAASGRVPMHNRARLAIAHR